MSSTSSFLYYIDPSCDAQCRQATGQPFDVYFRRAQHWAARALARLADPRDTDFARVFNVVMKSPPADAERLPRAARWQGLRRGGFQPPGEWQTARQHVRRDLAVLAGGWRPTPRRAAAHVRFFSDGRRRWRRVRLGGDGAGGAVVPFDPVNHVLHGGGDWAALAGGQAARTGLHPGWAVPADENPARWVVDFADGFWEGAEDEARLVGARRGDLGRVPVNDLIVSSVARVVFHEMMHAPPCHLDDVPRDGETCTWEVVMHSKKGQAHRNAESMAVLGLWAWLADTRPAGWRRGGYSLDRNWDRIPGSWEDIKNDFEEEDLDEEERKAGVTAGKSSQKWMVSRGNYAVRGVMILYADLTGSV